MSFSNFSCLNIIKFYQTLLTIIIIANNNLAFKSAFNNNNPMATKFPKLKAYLERQIAIKHPQSDYYCGCGVTFDSTN